ncbi:MAG: protein-L-isoaspartate O-methyltransferase [Alphaproteobacteria bacterium]|nr:protein-L-isoaspartate O-methyltransferase [Alphaproteobacteria bacterium]
MVESQLRTNKVTHPDLLAAMGSLPRELFVPEARQNNAYIDEDIEFGNGRCVMEPAVLARLVQAASVGPKDIALVIGCGAGYSVAVLASLAAAVFALESDTDLAKRAGDLLTELSLDNAVVVEGPLTAGWAKEGPYDVILMDGAVAEVPEEILNQLAEGGRLVAVVDAQKGVGHATLIGKRGGVNSHLTLFDAAIPTLPEFRAKAEFVF